jgi:hypothetical protein
LILSRSLIRVVSRLEFSAPIFRQHCWKVARGPIFIGSIVHVDLRRVSAALWPILTFIEEFAVVTSAANPSRQQTALGSLRFHRESF